MTTDERKAGVLHLQVGARSSDKGAPRRHTRHMPPRVFNSGRKKNRPSPIKSKYWEYRDFLFLFLFFIFYVYFLNLFFSETNIQKINFGR